MALYYGSWEYGGGNGMRVAMDITTSRVYHTSSTVTFTIKYYTQNQYRYNDYQFYSFGSLGGATQYNNTSGTNSSGGGLIYRFTKTYTYTYPAGSYGSSPTTLSFRGDVTGTYNGVTPSVYKVVSVPARPYDKPAPQTNLNLTLTAPTTIRATWTRRATSGEPYTSQEVGVGRAGEGFDYYVNLSGGSSAYSRTSGIVGNTVYRVSLRAINSAGSSSRIYSNYAATAPAAPSNVRSSLASTGASIKTTWTDNAYDPPSGYTKTFTVQRSVNGGAWTTMVTGLTGTTWTDNSPGAGTNRYQVRVVSNVPPAATSGFTPGNTVNTEVPPLAPTSLRPNGTTVDLDKALILSWTHNDGGDGAEQSAYSIEYSTDSGTTWTPLATGVVSEKSSHVIPAGTLPNSATPYQWRVSTRGVTTQPFGPWSAAATFTGTDAPVVTITAPGAVSLTTPLSVTWTFEQAQGHPQTYFNARLLSTEGTVLDSVTGASSSTRTVVFNGYRPEDAETYVITVSAVTTGNLPSNPASTTTRLELPVPAEVQIGATFGECSGTVALTLTTEGTGVIEPDRFNYSINPSAEVSAALWHNAFASNAVVRDITRAFVGTASIKATWDGTTGVCINDVPGLVVGQVYTATMRVYVPTGHERVKAVCYFNADGEETSVFDEWEELSVTFTATTDAHSVGIQTVSGTPKAGTVAWVDALCVTTGPERVPYFDGDTLDLPNREFSWTGTPHASTSLSQSRLEVAAISAIVERRVDGGEWITLTDALPVPTEFIDPLPSTTGATEYRVTSVSAIPSYRVNPIVTVTGPDGGWKDTAGYWGFLSYGDGYSKSVRVQGDVEIDETTGRARGVQPFLGRAKPVLLTGNNTERVISVAASLYWQDRCPSDEECRYSSSAAEWADAGLEATIVCWRDYHGRRIFGSLSDVDVSHTSLGTGRVGFKITEADYVERYLTFNERYQTNTEEP